MCIPALFAAIPGISATAATTASAAATAAITIGSVATSIAGSVGQAHTQTAVGKQRAEIAERNAQLSEAKSLDARNRAEAESSRIRTRAGRHSRRQRAIAAARGLDPTTGTAGALIDETRIAGELDARQASATGLSESAGFTAQAFNRRAAGSLATVTRSPGAAIGGAILQGGSSVASTWHRFKSDSSGSLFDPDPLRDLPTSVF